MTLAAMTALTVLGYEAQIMRATSEMLRRRHSANSMPEKTNLRLRCLLMRRMTMCAAAERRNSRSRTTAMGSSTAGVGSPPTMAMVDGYGGPWSLDSWSWMSLALASFHRSSIFAMEYLTYSSPIPMGSRGRPVPGQSSSIVSPKHCDAAMSSVPRTQPEP